jgi:hypothetical protein
MRIILCKASFGISTENVRWLMSCNAGLPAKTQAIIPILYRMIGDLSQQHTAILVMNK